MYWNHWFLLQITIETDYPDNWAKPSAKRIKYKELFLSWCSRHSSPWSYLSWACWWSQLAFKSKLFPSKTCPLMVRSPKFICLSKTGWREMDCDWHFKSKLGSAKQMIRIKQMWMVYTKNKSWSLLFSIKVVLYEILGMHFVRIW